MNNAFKKFDLTGKTALVTGGATGIGYYMTRGLMRSGAKVIIASRKESVLKEAAAKLRSESEAGEILYHTVDLGDRGSIQGLVDHCNKTMGGVDIFIGNAVFDVLTGAAIEQITDDVVDKLHQVNIGANVSLMRAFLPRMRKNKWGRIIFSSSTASLRSSANDGMGIYGGSKSALNAIARAAATEVGHDGITVNTILLGVFKTQMLVDTYNTIDKAQGAAAAKGFMDSFTSMSALGRLADCPEVEGFIQMLASDAGSYVTGANLPLDGGLGCVLRPNPPPAEPVYPKNL